MLKINPQRSPGRIKRWENLYQGDIRRAPLRETLKKAKTEGESISWAKRPTAIVQRNRFTCQWPGTDFPNQING